MQPGSPGAPMARLRGAMAGFAAAAALVVGVLPLTTAGAQNPAPRTTQIIDEAGVSVPLTRPAGFNMFAEADVAASGMRMTGTYGWQFPNVAGPCPWYYTFGSSRCGILTNQAGGTTETFFEYGFAAGVPISDFRKIRAVHPGINNMRAPLGYSVAYRFELAPPVSRRWGAADGQFGALFSGVTSTSDGSCRDHTGFGSGTLPAGVTLTAGLDCPDTWANGTFAGQQLITRDTWLARAQSNPGAFQFDSWKVPAAQREPAFLGDFQTYGAWSDHYREILQRFGSVTPQGTGAPTERGFPLGLEVRYDAWQYSRPSIRNVVWYQMTIVNKTAQVYGQGVDFDSLYMAFTPGFLMSGSGAQATAGYFDMDRNTFIAAGHGTSGQCSANYPRRVPSITTGCTTTRGFADGATAFVVLKSPLGDTRNKLFTRAGSPFSSLAVPETIKDDTLTFNHAKYSQFGGPANNFMNRNDKAFFGYMASIEELFLDGRTATDLGSVTVVYRHFMNENWRNFTGSLSGEYLKFPRFVPGSTNQPNTAQNPQPGQPYGKWDYNNDGVQDTVYVPGCGSQGCHDIYSDTLVSGLHNYFGNVANLLGMGPVKLKAGDTTQILIAMVGSSDPLQFEAAINSTIDTYLNFYAGPAAVRPPELTSADVQVTPAEVRDITVGAATAQIRLRIPQLGSSADPFIQNIANTIRTSTVPSVVRLRNLNPGLVAQIEARARNNLAEILVFKSCDKGATFTTQTYNRTTGAGCRPAPAVGPTGAQIGFGWQPFAIIPVDTANVPATRFITDVVQAGRSYLYSFVTRTRGIIDIPLVDSIGGQIRPTNLAKALNLDADTIVSSLARSGPSTVTVYAPISLPAGTRAAVLDTSTISGTGTTRITAAQTGGELVTGRYRLFFANRFIVTTTQEVGSNRVLTTEVRAQRVISSATTNGTTRDTNFVAAEQVFTADGPIFTSSDVTIPSNLVSTVNGVRTYRDVITVSAANVTGYILARVAGGTPRALYISTTGRGSSAGPVTAFQNVPFFPGFNLTWEAATAGVNVPRLNRVIRAEGDTIDNGVVTNNGVIWLGAAASSQSLLYAPGGTFKLLWSDDAFGPRSPFTFTTIDALQQQVAQSLAARNNSSTTEVSDDIRALVAPRAAASGADTTRPLQAFNLPFRVTGLDGRPARVAMFRRYRNGANAATDSILNNSRLFGNVGDTARVPVPSNLWVPGDTLYVVETIQRDSTRTIGGVSTVVLSEQTIGGRTVRAPIQVLDTIVSARMVLTCAGSTTPATTQAPRCNPLVPQTFAATGYLPYKPGWTSIIDFARPFDLFNEIEINAAAPSAVGVQLVKADLEDVKVVPNPYIVQSNFDEIGGGRVGTPRVLFTSVPVAGQIRVYSVSGQLIQQINWTEADLENIGAGRLVGDLPFTLRTREGLEMGSGLYVFVLESRGTGPKLTKRGKFVIIR